MNAIHARSQLRYWPTLRETLILARAFFDRNQPISAPAIDPGMPVPRREFLAVAGAAVIAPLGVGLAPITAAEEATTMYGLIGKMTSRGRASATRSSRCSSNRSSQCQAASATSAWPTDPADADALWITEVWDSAGQPSGLPVAASRQGHHRPKTRPIIAGFSNRVETAANRRIRPAKDSCALARRDRCRDRCSSKVLDQHQLVDRRVNTRVEYRAAVSRRTQARADGAEVTCHGR